MLFQDLLQETYFSLLANKARSSLTILGIVIGIASVITMVSIGQGAAQDIESSMSSLGSNLLVVMPGSSQGPGSVVRGGSGSATTLVVDDAEAIAEKIDNIDAVASSVSSREQVRTTGGNNTNTSIYGVDPSYASIKSINLTSGTFLNNTHNQKLSKVAVIGPDTSVDLFGEGVDPIGQKIRISNLEFTIIGLTESKGGTGFNNSDDLIYIPLATAQKYIQGSESVSNINIQVREEELMTSVQNEVTSLLLTRHKIVDPTQADFSVINQADLMDAVTSVAGTMTLLLGAIAGISLLVGGIGIMNMMLTTVTERTREIGLRKSLGAKNKNISWQFLAESVALTFIGGLVGVFIGWAASAIVTEVSGTTTAVSLYSILLAFGVSALIGIVFGYYPARRAAKLDPIEALRYE